MQTNTQTNQAKMYITSPIYYVNDVPHIGHAYSTLLCDMLKRFYTLQGADVLFTTGTDEHGQKIEQSAQKHELSPKDYADRISARFQALWDEFHIDYDIFIRTTEPKHCQSVQKAFEIMYAKGDIYKGSYEGHYCVSCESFFTQTQLAADKSCPDCGKATQIVQEESYFFALSKYQERLLSHFRTHRDMIAPSFYQNEIVHFIEQGLNDLSITRTSFEWGVPLLANPKREDSKKHVMYVWLDALLSYISPLGYMDDNAKMSYWDNATHLVGKDILRFHAVYWLAFLMSLELPLPQHIYVNGWWTREGIKMSKSIGNVINPKDMAQSYGIESLRYFLLREMPFGQDGDFSEKVLVERINTELGNDMGNLLNRLCGMSEKYFALRLSYLNDEELHFSEEYAKLHSLIESAQDKMYAMMPHRYIEEIWKMFALGNNAISKYEPWKLIKDGQNEKVKSLLYLIANILAKSALLLYPIMPQTAVKIAHVLGFSIDAEHFHRFIAKKQFLPSTTLRKIPPLFPRVQKIESTDSINTADSVDSIKHIESHQQSAHKNRKNMSVQDDATYIDIADFQKLDIRVGTIMQCEALPKSQKLLKLLVDIGEETPRQILSGIATFYDTQSLIGKQVCLLVNLKPAKMMGEISEGMILASKDDNGLSLLSIDSTRANGSKIS